MAGGMHISWETYPLFITCGATGAQLKQKIGVKLYSSNNTDHVSFLSCPYLIACQVRAAYLTACCQWFSVS